MVQYLAAAQCPRCPSDTADFVFVEGIHPVTLTVVTVGGLYRCRVCSLRWIEPVGGARLIPDDFYWSGHEFD
jgi:hypothetical protein